MYSGECRGTILINPATGVRQGYYRPFAEFLAERGWRVLTFDNRGIGGSRPASLRGFRARMQDWAELDSEGMLLWLVERYPGAPTLLVGHSFGGQALGLMPAARQLDGALLVAVQSGYWGHWPLWHWPRSLFLWYLMIPITTTMLGYFPARRLGLGEDQPAGVARQWAYWGRHRDYLLRDGNAAWRAGYEALTLPILGLGLSDDSFAPRRAMAAILALYSRAEVEHRHIVPRQRGLGAVGHFGFFRPRFRATLWEEAAAWLEGCGV
jgi:predicted alpha/beta hydrolase